MGKFFGRGFAHRNNEKSFQKTVSKVQLNNADRAFQQVFRGNPKNLEKIFL
jgi:hypothetical protein